MTNEEIIKKAEEKGMKEYSANKNFQHHDRGWLFKINSNVFITLHFWQHTLRGAPFDGWEFVVYAHDDDKSQRYYIHNWKDFDLAWTEIERFLAFQLHRGGWTCD